MPSAGCGPGHDAYSFSGRSESDQIPVPVEGDAELIAERLRTLLIEDRGPGPEPETLQQRYVEWRSIVDGEIVLALIGRLLSRGRIDGVPSPREVGVGAQAFRQQVREVVGGADQHGL